MESQAARITRYVILAVFLCLGLIGLVIAIILWRTPPATNGLTAFDLLVGFAGLLALAWLWSAWAVLLRCRRHGIWIGGFVLACVTVADAGLLGCAANGDCYLPPAPLLGVYGLFWALAVTGAVLAMRERHRRLRG